MKCPKCGSENVAVQTMQENVGSTTVTKTKSKYKEAGHSVWWWIFIGSWWWMIDIFLWIFLFIPRLIAHAGRKRNYKGKSQSVSTTENKIEYKTLCTCQNCGKSWTV